MLRIHYIILSCLEPEKFVEDEDEDLEVHNRMERSRLRKLQKSLPQE